MKKQKKASQMKQKYNLKGNCGHISNCEKDQIDYQYWNYYNQTSN